ncbi:ribosome-recycling factor Frr [Paenibacillus larvae subsp. larvae]|uniref:Ribosome-recycling factor n=4 Tax=Paenibacillus larvae TaxID=1464 RepID=V9W8A2_9BACL|nr:ribosome recycling factor [Paenibacillus larvae]AHD05925.1 ribosome-recycling factor Frr [Paenibacillus larvae subsp. larvae DSM 25430]AQZ48752.1 ribosome-recycling factor [Paenibacillus larvae subsp. pulvifaciens]ARF69944.1 ribosome-recycling factor [Paenibacillus larvae subsp. pulvifaciens]AVF26845.1 ribosome-recycling factor Frr [Paenibacillus larvae subsp. larvae]AVF31596.1 ribosome-recycling factor Frr [Paenibacillus larvae subsp. larvae]
MPQSVKKNAEDRMQKAVAALQKELASLRAGRATPALLDRVQVEYYGAMTPLNQLANINVPDPRTLLIQPWDKSSLGAIEKAILKSELGLTPTSDGTMIRLTIPPLTEERRLELVKMTKKYGEDAKVAIRNIRRDSNESIKKMEKTEISEDESRRHQDDIQKSTDKYIAEVDKVLAAKEKEIMEV